MESREQGAWSRERGAGSVEQGEGSEERKTEGGAAEGRGERKLET
jgi:hypothetical protein